MQVKRCLWFLMFVLLASVGLKAQDSPKFSTYYFQRFSHFKTLSSNEGSIVFLGNSITDGAEWSELFNDPNVQNRGISGDITDGVLYRLKEVTDRKPAKVFLLIGVNDLAEGKSAKDVVDNILRIATEIKRNSAAVLFVQSILPVNDKPGTFEEHVNKGPEIIYINTRLRDSAKKYGYTYIDLYSSFADSSGKMDLRFSNDGLHLMGAGYLLWQQLIYPFVYDAQPQPSLIPQPQQLEWRNSFFPLYSCQSIIVKDTAIIKEGKRLQQMLKRKGYEVPLNSLATDKQIELRISPIKVEQNEDEAYSIEVDSSKILITAGNAHGMFNAIQTLDQLSRNRLTVPSCKITDWPAFSWRGYMIDVGRNYMPIDLLKQQIEIMSRYKLNIFHFHFTEDIAWRLSIKRYPQLTGAETMIRNKGEFYSEADMKDLINFCRERYITLVPEIDMPGHSAAFKRAMHTDMQSDSGLAIVKNILKEFFETYDLPYIHIGADEVKITNKDFLPDVISFIKGYNKKIIGWEPGGNFSDDVIRQLWMDDVAALSDKTNLKFIDSRHLYLNHMDPLEAVTTLFFRQIGNKKRGDSSVLGATLCMWPDRRVSEPIDVFRMNPLYPGMVTFSERVWNGGGISGWTAVIGEPGSETATEFAAFENKLLDHKRQYFSTLPFPYVKQSSTVWSLYGPFDNGGDLKKKFIPEMSGFDTVKVKPFVREVGGTIVLRHWWYPLIMGVIQNPKENSTVYALTSILSKEDGYKEFWVGFNNLSRSPATDSPPLGFWDEKGSEVWVNGSRVSPPNWKRAGMKGDSEIPLIDEGYEYRPPVKIFLRKGWNQVMIKAPVGSFKGKDWQNPVKWQFTFVETDDN